jgi:hypothetical protein
VLHRDWFDRTGGHDDEASRQVWAGLLDQLILHARDGFRVPAPARHTTGH